MGKCFFGGALLLVWSVIGDHYSAVRHVAGPGVCEGMASEFRQRFYWIEATCLPEIQAAKADRLR